MMYKFVEYQNQGGGEYVIIINNIYKYIYCRQYDN